jgi:hypothetical protein
MTMTSTGDAFTEEALTYVYIAQNVRSSGDGPSRAGVLLFDCRRYFSELEGLLQEDYVERRSWHQLEGFCTTSKGTSAAHRVVLAKLAAGEPEIAQLLEDMPKPMAQFLLQCVLLADQDAARQVRLPSRLETYCSGAQAFGQSPEDFFCLLRRSEVTDARDRLLELLVSLGLAVTGHDYVSTGGGRVDELIYVPAPELTEFARRYLAKTGRGTALWPLELVGRHVALHLLNAQRLGAQSRHELELNTPIRVRDEFREFLRQSLSSGLLKEEIRAGDRYFTCKDPLAFQERVYELFREPLFQHLLAVPEGSGREATAQEVALGSAEGTRENRTQGQPGETPAPNGQGDHEEQDAYVIIGDDKETDTGLLGWSSEKTAVRLDMFVGKFVGAKGPEERAHTISVFGIQGSGKSYTLGAILEMAVSPQGTIRTGKPLPAVVFHYDQNVIYKPEFAKMVDPTPVDSDIETLKKTGAQPRGLNDVVVLVPPWRVSDRIKEFPGANVSSLTFSPEELGQSEWMLLMGVPGSAALYVNQMKQVFLKLDVSKDLSLQGVRNAVDSSSMSESSKSLAIQRLDLASLWIKQGPGMKTWLKPGRLTILDIRDQMIDPNDAMRLCLICLGLFQQIEGDDGSPLPKVIVLDEAHKYVKQEFADHIVTVVNQMRHTGTTVVIASQSPDSIPSDVLEKSSVVLLHRLTAATQINYLKKAVQGLSRIDNAAVSRLQKGHALAWANTSTDPRVTDMGLEVAVRPRFSRHV